MVVPLSLGTWDSHNGARLPINIEWILLQMQTCTQNLVELMKEGYLPHINIILAYNFRLNM